MMSKKLFWLFSVPLLGLLLCIKPASGAVLETSEASHTYEEGLKHYLGVGLPKNSQRAAALFEQAATLHNHPAAQFNLGVLYEHGEGVPKNMDIAVQWYQRAANQNYAKAQYNLGYLLLEGFGLTKDPIKAIEWLEKAAYQGHAHAEYQLGCAYLEAKGVTHNRPLALEWLKRAAAHHHPDAAQTLSLAQSMP